MRPRLACLLLAASLVLAGCGSDQPDEPGAIRFTEVELPAGAKPIVLTPVGDLLAIGVRRDGGPGLLWLGPHGALTSTFEETPVRPAGMYGEQAYWYSIAADESQVVAIGGKTGGAHGNVRWSVWRGSVAGLAEQPQPFSTFGGYGAGDLVDAVLTPEGPALIGTWQNPSVGLDIMVWRPDGKYWERQAVAGTALENERESLKFPLAASGAGEGALIVGWELAGGRQRPVVWRADRGVTGWRMTRLPDAGRAGAAVSVSCTGGTCMVAGWVDGKLALWELRADRWTRVRSAPVPVSPNQDLASPVASDGHPAEVLADGSRVVLASSSARGVEGPSGKVVATARVGRTLYVATEDKLWQAELS